VFASEVQQPSFFALSICFELITVLHYASYHFLQLYAQLFVTLMLQLASLLEAVVQVLVRVCLVLHWEQLVTKSEP